MDEQLIKKKLFRSSRGFRGSQVSWEATANTWHSASDFPAWQQSFWRPVNRSNTNPGFRLGLFHTIDQGSNIGSLNNSFIFLSSPKIFFSRMRSKGSRFTLAVWGLRVCSLDVAFAFATVRGRSREGRMAVPMGEFCKSGYFWRFHMSRSFVSRGRRGTLRHSNMFHNLSKFIFWCGRRHTFASFSEDELQFSWQRSTLETSVVMSRGKRST